jgi:hypothetical protein
MFTDRCSDSVLGQHSAKYVYNILLDSNDHAIKIVERNVDIDYSFVFKNISDRFIDKFSRDVMHRIIHGIIPVDILMFKYTISKTHKCVFCKEVETLRHLFFECTFNSQLLSLIKNWIFDLSNGIIFKKKLNIMLQEIDISNDQVRNVILMIILYINILSQLKLRVLTVFESLLLLNLIVE